MAVTITPGYQFDAGERITNAKLNQLGQPVGVGEVGGAEVEEVRSQMVTVPLSLYADPVLGTGEQENFDVAFPGALSGEPALRQHWHVQMLDPSEVSQWIYLTPVCFTDGELRIIIKTHQELTADELASDLPLRVTLFRFKE